MEISYWVFVEGIQLSSWPTKLHPHHSTLYEGEHNLCEGMGVECKTSSGDEWNVPCGDRDR